MNLMTLLKPKGEIEYLHKEDTLRQGLERMRIYGYTALPESYTNAPFYLLSNLAYLKEVPMYKDDADRKRYPLPFLSLLLFQHT